MTVLIDQCFVYNMGLRAFCDCGYSHLFTPDDLRPHVRLGQKVEALRTRLTCRECGARGAGRGLQFVPMETLRAAGSGQDIRT